MEGDDNKDLLFCTYCKKRRHTKENCWKLAWKNQNTGKKAYATSSQLPSTQAAVTSPATEEVQQKLSSTALVNLGNSPPHEWIADTGATDHMSPSERLFNKYSPARSAPKVQTSGGGALTIRGVGDICLSPLGILKKVLHVEDLRANLISIQKIVDDYGWRFVLDSDSCFLCDKVSGRNISSFRREGGLLFLDPPSPQCLVSQL